MFDAHNHLQDPLLTPYREEILEALAALPLEAAVVNGTTQKDWPEVEGLSRQFPWVIPSYGLHPWYCSQRADGWEQELEGRLAAGGSAVGEVGLDRWMQHYDLEDQKAVLRRHLELAHRHSVPITIHCLRAWGALLELLLDGPIPECGFLLHAYGGPTEMVAKFVELGGWFSFSGSFLSPGRERKLEPFREIPSARLLAETDAPAMPLALEVREFELPSHESGDVNHPANLRAVYRGLANLRGLEQDELDDLLRSNFRRLFAPVLPQPVREAEPAE